MVILPLGVWNSARVNTGPLGVSIYHVHLNTASLRRMQMIYSIVDSEEKRCRVQEEIKDWLDHKHVNNRGHKFETVGMRTCTFMKIYN